MPPATKQKIIAVKVSSATKGDTIAVRNITQGWSTNLLVDGNGEAAYDPTNDDNTCEASDRIRVQCVGRLSGIGTGTISGGGVKISVTGAANTVTQSVSL